MQTAKRALSCVFSRARLGVEAPLVQVEAHIVPSALPSFHIVGLPETAVRESRDRVRSAIINSGYQFPRYRITVNLAPADLPKEGGRFDLAIAVGVLLASQQLDHGLCDRYELIGEVGLDGVIRRVDGVLPIALASAAAQRALIVPIDNADEAALAHQAEILPARNLLEVCAHLNQETALVRQPPTMAATSNQHLPDLSEVRGQQQAKRALVIAAAGGHHMLMVGPPGSGKTMLAARLPTLLPRLQNEQALESAAVSSIAGEQVTHWHQPPFRHPHHTASAVALIGGGSDPRPGEVSLAHHGVLFLDELTEFERRVLEVLREPLESGEVVIARAARRVRFPARFQLIAALNPCPCGFFGSHQRSCHCTPDQIQRYQRKISGPFLDRIDLIVNVPHLQQEAFFSTDAVVEQPVSATARQWVEQAQQCQFHRQGKLNRNLEGKELESYCALETGQLRWLSQVISRLQLSMRSFHRILKVARTIADLENAPRLTDHHLREAVAYRRNELAQAAGAS